MQCEEAVLQQKLENARKQLCFLHCPAQCSALPALVSGIPLARLTKITKDRVMFSFFFFNCFLSQMKSGWNTWYFRVSFAWQSKVKLLTVRVNYAGLARSLLHAHQWALQHEPVSQGELWGCTQALARCLLLWCIQLAASGGIHLTAHQHVLGWKNIEICFFHDFKLFSEKAKTCKVLFGFVNHFFSFLPFPLLFPLKDRQVFFKTTAHLVGK